MATTAAATTTPTPSAKRLAQLLIDRFKLKKYHRNALTDAMQTALGDKQEDHLRAIFEWAATDPFWSKKITDASFPDRYVLSSLHTIEDRFAKQATKAKRADQPRKEATRDAEARLADFAEAFANQTFPNLSPLEQLIVLCATIGQFDRNDFAAQTNNKIEDVDRAFQELVELGLLPSDPDQD